MVQKDKYIRFDWAVKRLLRNKANFGVLEGFLTVLLGEPIRIVEILESEGNQQRENDKFNRVDIKARNSKDEIIIVEVQNTREIYYLERILFGVAKAITEHIELGRTLLGSEEGVLHQHSLFRHWQRQRLPVPRSELLCGRAYGRFSGGHHQRKGCHRAQTSCRNLPRIFPDSSE